MGTESFSGLMRLERGADYSPPSNAGLQKDGICTAGYPLCLLGNVIG